MKQKLYETYVNKIQKAVNLNRSGNVFNMHDHINSSDYGLDLIKGIMTENRGLEPKTELQTLAALLNISNIKIPVKGDHPDFADIRITGRPEYHYIVSMFIDVKGSTRFHTKYNLEQIALIIQTIVVAATHTVSLFGGHIQRLQYDGVFCYFGGKGVKKEEAVANAMKAASFFNYFIKYELNEVFELEGIEDIYTRAGIDFGDDHEVQWVVFGTNNCDELTTNSLHTSLAPKMQANASVHGIVVGKNIWEKLGSAQIYADYIRDKNGNVDETQRYIYKDTNKAFYYSQHTFDWKAFLKNTFWFVNTDSTGNLYLDNSNTRKESIDEQRRLGRLFDKTVAISTGGASINKQGQIQNNAGGTTIPSNRFYYDKEGGK